MIYHVDASLVDPAFVPARWAYLPPNMQRPLRTHPQACRVRSTVMNTQATETVSVSTTPASAQPIRVFYDGSCPLCRAEIGFLQRQRGSDALAFEDVSSEFTGDDEVVEGLTCRAAMARMHVALPNGEVVSGARAFLAMWGALPRFRLAARLLSTPPLPWLLEGAYRGFLVVRPQMQRMARNRTQASSGL